MIALDTNVLVRLITRDDAAQAAAVDALLSTPGEVFFLPDLVLAELAWARLKAGQFDEIVSLAPIYLRTIEAIAG